MLDRLRYRWLPALLVFGVATVVATALFAPLLAAGVLPLVAFKVALLEAAIATMVPLLRGPRGWDECCVGPRVMAAGRPVLRLVGGTRMPAAPPDLAARG